MCLYRVPTGKGYTDAYVFPLISVPPFNTVVPPGDYCTHSVVTSWRNRFKLLHHKELLSHYQTVGPRKGGGWRKSFLQDERKILVHLSELGYNLVLQSQWMNVQFCVDSAELEGVGTTWLRSRVSPKWVMYGRVQLKCDGTRWRTGGEVKGKLANGVGSLYSSHYLGTWCIQHYYRWCAHLGCQ
jgi:hypothetical protein